MSKGAATALALMIDLFLPCAPSGFEKTDIKECRFLPAKWERLLGRI
jgi:hypothetical protein